VLGAAAGPAPLAGAGSGADRRGLYDWLGYRQRWRLLEAVAPPYVSARAPIVIGGCGRSGTSLLQALLGRHPAIFAGPEATVFLERVSAPAELGPRFRISPARIEAMQRQSRSQAEFIDRFAEDCLERSGKTVWAEKTPENVGRLGFLWRHFPKARFIHVIRDGRDVICSLRESPWMKLPHAREREAEHCALYWARRIAWGRRHRSDPRYYEIRYEDLVESPEHELRLLLEWLGMDVDAGILQAMIAAPEARDRARLPSEQPIFDTSVGRWQRHLSAAERRAVEAASGSLLGELGYRRP
jgi:hypothetical protein